MLMYTAILAILLLGFLGLYISQRKDSFKYAFVTITTMSISIISLAFYYYVFIN